MKTFNRFWAVSVAVLLIVSTPRSRSRAQDSVKGAEPIVASIDTSDLTYDYLVDGSLPQDDPANKKYKTLQAAYAAAPEGTEVKPTVIGIKPNVYQLPGGNRTPSMSITKNFITFLGLTNNRRSVELADNRGHLAGADDNGYILNVNATGFTMRNLTVLNYCNADYEYPGDASKNLKMRLHTITQAVSLQAAGDKHVYENVALLGRHDTIFLQATRSYFKNVYIEGTEDFIGGGQFSVWEDCTIIFPTGDGVMQASGIAFLNCRFESTGGLEFYKSEFGSGGSRPVALINCVMPVNSPKTPVAWVRGKAAPRPSLYSLTYHLKDADGNPTRIYDSTLETNSFTYTRELSDREALAFNPWNILRAATDGTVDDWDPAGAKQKYEDAGQGSAIFRMALNSGGPPAGGRGVPGLAVTPSPLTIRTGQPGVTIGATVVPARTPDRTIKWSTTSDLISLSQTTGPSVVVTARNTTGEPQYVAVNATAANGFYVTAYVYVEPQYDDPPAVTAGPMITAPANGTVSVNYTLGAPGKEDHSVISWSICDDSSGTNPREVAVSRGNAPLKVYSLTPGDIGKYIKVAVKPKHKLSDPGPAVTAMAASPIAVSDIKSPNISPNFRNFVATANNSYISGLWTMLGTWTIQAGEGFENGYGIRVASRGASLLYQQDGDLGDMQIDLVMTPEKPGMGFGSPGSPEDGDATQKSEIFIEYDPRTRNGYSLRYWATLEANGKCRYQLYKIVNGVGSPLNDKQAFTGVFKRNTRMTLKIIGNKFTVEAHNDVDGDVRPLREQ
jgi:hypothetical protein